MAGFVASSSSFVHVHTQTAREVIRAIRGKRSQVALARRLGYRGNPLTDWERGVRHPTAKEVLRVASVCRLPVKEAFVALVPLEPPRLLVSAKDAPTKGWVVHPWLNALRGNVSHTELAGRLGVSRYAVSRWCSGDTDLRFDEFLAFINVLTGRLYDWVASLVPIERVPSLLAQYEQGTAARTVALEHPWTEAILRVLETESYQRAPAVAHATLAATLGVSESTLQQALDGLMRASVIVRREEPVRGHPYYEVRGQLSVDTRTNPGAVRRLQRHWLDVARDRAEQGEEDWFAYNVFSCSEADFERVRDGLKRAFRESRSIIASSEPNETAGMVLMQLVNWKAR
jgi:transcriptional regulator with XRE-family HTH domain